MISIGSSPLQAKIRLGDVGQIAEIRVSDAYLDKKLLFVNYSRGGKKRQIEITEELGELIERILATKPRMYLLENKGKQIGVNSLSCMFRDARDAAELTNRHNTKSARYAYIKHRHDLHVSLSEILSELGLKADGTHVRYQKFLDLHSDVRPKRSAEGERSLRTSDPSKCLKHSRATLSLIRRQDDREVLTEHLYELDELLRLGHKIVPIGIIMFCSSILETLLLALLRDYGSKVSKSKLTPTRIASSNLSDLLDAAQKNVPTLLAADCRKYDAEVRDWRNLIRPGHRPVIASESVMPDANRARKAVKVLNEIARQLTIHISNQTP